MVVDHILQLYVQGKQYISDTALSSGNAYEEASATMK